MRRDPSRLLEYDNGQRNFQDGISICQEEKWQYSTASQQPLLWRVRHGPFGIDSLSQSSYLKWAVGNIAPADLQTVCIVPSRPKKPRLRGHDATPSVASRAHPPPVFQISSLHHGSPSQPLPCVGRCLVRPLLTSSSNVPESRMCVYICDWLGRGPGWPRNPLFLGLPSFGPAGHPPS